MKVCEMCGAQNDDVFTKCSVWGADLPSPNGEAGDDEKTVLIDPTEAAAPQSGLSLKTDTNTYGQADANAAQPQPGFGGQPQGMPGQPGFGGQPQGMPGQPGFGGQPQGMPGQMGFGGQPQGMPGQMGFGGQPQGMPGQPGFGGQPSQQPKSKKGLIFGVLGAAVVVLAIALVLIFKGGFGGNGAKSPEDVARLFIEAMDEKDADKMAKLCPPFLDPGKDEIEDMISMYDGMDVKFTYEGVESKDEYKGDDLKDFEDEVSDYADKNIKLQGACDLEFSFNIKMSYLGENYDESSTYTLKCIKYKGKWYLYE